MGKKTPTKSSCFNIFACCSDSAVQDHSIEPSAQAKASGKKHCWSFKKRSATHHRVLINNLTSETETPTFPVNSSEEKTDEKQLPAESNIFEEVVVAVPEPHVSTELNPSTKTMLSSQDDHLEEPMIIIIQTGVRGFLAQRELVKLRSTVKLQAAIRGHLARRQAVDTLHCKTSEIMEEDVQSQPDKNFSFNYLVEEASKTFSHPDEEYQSSKSLSSEEKMEIFHDSKNESFEELLDTTAQKNQNSDSLTQPDSLSSNLTSENQVSEHPTEITVSEQADVENSESAYGSTKASNQTFIVDQSKFEESSSEVFIPIETRIKNGGSECGTELSVTSTLDSPDHEDQVYEMELNTKFPEDSKPIAAVDEHDNDEYVVLNIVSDSAHITPSTKVSAKTRKNKDIKSTSNKKHSSNTNAKKAVVKSNQDSGVRSKGEQLPKDKRSGKTRKSTKADNVDEERRDSTSSVKAVPSYMQATKSAKAKTNSPRSSPDVQEKDAYIIKKRQSHTSHSPQSQTVNTRSQ